MCFACFSADAVGRSPHANAFTRRGMLHRLSAIGLSLPLAAALSSAANAAELSPPSATDLVGGLQAIIAKANSPELVAYRTFEINGSDLPWSDLGLDAAQGQQVTFLLGGRVWLSREHDVWFEPGVAFHARTRGTKPMYNPMTNTGTMTAAHGGIIEIARSAGEWANDSGALWTPEAIYKQADVKIAGIALLWRGDAGRGLKSLAAQGDVGGVLQTEIARLDSGRKLPEGWSNLFMFGGGPVIFSRGDNGEIVCQTQRTVGILQRQAQLPLLPGTRLSWRWMMESLPSLAPEDQAPVHDYLSIAVEFDDGQDLTYLWSEGLAQGKVFRCPLPRWQAIETHMVVRSGSADLGKWLQEERDIQADYAAHIGGAAKTIVRVWLIAVSVFQRRQGACRYAGIQLSSPDGSVLQL